MVLSFVVINRICLFKSQPSSVSENQVNQQKQMIPSERDKPAGLQMSDFLPVSGFLETFLSVPVPTYMPD